jgi:6-phosphogluconolactonase
MAENLMSVSEFTSPSREALTAALADFIQSELATAVAKRGHASLVVSGGSTPRPLFEALVQRQLPWKNITVTLADERWVDSTSKDSNEAMLRETLLHDAAVNANFIPLKNSAATAVAGLELCEQSITSIARPFDLVILGMGDDGHTASLFPGVAGSAFDTNKPDLCAAITPGTAPHERMSLTARAILDSRKILLHIVGDNKWRVYQQAMEKGAIDDLPVRVVLHQHKVPVDVYWSV